MFENMVASQEGHSSKNFVSLANSTLNITYILVFYSEGIKFKYWFRDKLS
jgi:hypothetical protein